MLKATTNKYMMVGNRKISPGSPAACWKMRTAVPKVAAKPSPTEIIRYQGATTLRSSSPTMIIRTAASGNTTR